MPHLIPIVHRVIPFLFGVFVLGIFGPSTAQADIYIAPVLPSATSTYANFGAANGFFFQYIGTGLTGAITAFEYDFEVISWSGPIIDAGGGNGFDVYEFNSEADALSFLSGGTVTSTTYTSTNNSYLEGDPGVYTWVWNGTEGTVDNLTMNASKYYVISLRLFRGGTNDQGVLRLFGVSNNVFGQSCATATRDYNSNTPNPCSGTSLNTLSFDMTGPGNINETDDTTTRIVTVDPPNLSSVATTSLPYDFEVYGYVNAGDYEDGTRVMIKLDRNTDQQAVGALAGWNSAFGNKTFLDVDNAGYFTVATSSDSLNLDFEIREGLYNARWEIQAPQWSILGFDFNYKTLVSTTTRFVVATTTAIDNIQLDQEEYLQDIVDSLGDPLSSCSFNWFEASVDFSLGSNLIDCLGGLAYWAFVPPPSAVTATVDQLREGFLTRVPLGYFTRIVDAVSSGEMGALPTVTANIPISPSEDITIEFDIDDMVEGSANLTDSFEDPDGNTLRDIGEPIIQLIVGLLVLAFIFNDIINSARRI